MTIPLEYLDECTTKVTVLLEYLAFLYVVAFVLCLTDL